MLTFINSLTMKNERVYFNELMLLLCYGAFMLKKVRKGDDIKKINMMRCDETQNSLR